MMSSRASCICATLESLTLPSPRQRMCCGLCGRDEPADSSLASASPALAGGPNAWASESVHEVPVSLIPAVGSLSPLASYPLTQVSLVEQPLLALNDVSSPLELLLGLLELLLRRRRRSSTTLPSAFLSASSSYGCILEASYFGESIVLLHFVCLEAGHEDVGGCEAGSVHASALDAMHVACLANHHTNTRLATMTASPSSSIASMLKHDAALQ